MSFIGILKYSFKISGGIFKNILSNIFVLIPILFVWFMHTTLVPYSRGYTSLGKVAWVPDKPSYLNLFITFVIIAGILTMSTKSYIIKLFRIYNIKYLFLENIILMLLFILFLKYYYLIIILLLYLYFIFILNWFLIIRGYGLLDSFRSLHYIKKQSKDIIIFSTKHFLLFVLNILTFGVLFYRVYILSYYLFGVNSLDRIGFKEID